MGYKATVVPAVKITKGNFTYTLHKGDTLDKIVFAFAHGKVTLENAELYDFELKVAAANTNRRGPVYDSLATDHAAIDMVGNFRDSSKWYDVKTLLVKGPQSETEIISIEIDKIETIAGTFENEDGTKTTGVDITEDSSTLQEAVSAANENDMIVVSEGEVAEEISVDTGVTLAGINAGVPQNHAQEEVA